MSSVPAPKLQVFAESTMTELLGWYGYESRNQDVKVTTNGRTISESNDSDGEGLKFNEGGCCGWCGKLVNEHASVISATAVFCSELCFAQSRRASFKRNKTCDWCRITRNNISYVDIQDNATQLQFCSDKCLNQYKMHIFCRETKAHLELHPHLYGVADSSSSSSSAMGLITPDLWLKNCTSPKPMQLSPVQSEPLQLISVASPSKLLAAADDSSGKSKIHRSKSKKLKKMTIYPATITKSSIMNNDIPQDLRVKQVIEPDGVPPPVVSSEPMTLDSMRNILGNILPSPTTFVPYPVILPLPIPIPVPIPIPKIFKSNTGKDLIVLQDNSTQTNEITSINNNNNNNSNNSNNNLLEENAIRVVSEQVTSNRRLLRKRTLTDFKLKNPKPKKT
ncbi:hypothetical protein ABEB36_004806 [Hypothenemus hampei]|uniref:Uncharacterized protein n=1 Tax=Hypothenemus hampei TaxID=57062 RepID=A0ABD1EVW4_HYPHA